MKFYFGSGRVGHTRHRRHPRGALCVDACSRTYKNTHLCRTFKNAEQKHLTQPMSISGGYPVHHDVLWELLKLHGIPQNKGRSDHKVFLWTGLAHPVMSSLDASILWRYQCLRRRTMTYIFKLPVSSLIVWLRDMNTYQELER